MATNVSADNVSTGAPKVGGAVFYAPVGTALPTDAKTPLDEAFLSVGYISEDGVTFSESRESQDFKEWGGSIVGTQQTEKKDTVKFKMIEILNVNALKAAYGTKNVTGDLTAGMTVDHTNSEPEELSWVFEMVMHGGILKRTVIPKAKITELGDVNYKLEYPAGLETTMQALYVGNSSHKDYYLKPTA